MDGIEKITARISDDVRAEIGEIEAEAARQTEEIGRKYQETAERERGAVLNRGHLAAAEREQRLTGVAALEAKKEILAIKQEMISRVFAKAEEKLSLLPADEYVSLLAALIVRAAKNGEEQIILSPRDRERYGEAVVKEANKRLPDGKFTLAAGSRGIKGGLLLSQGDVEINCSFASLIQQLRGELTPQVAHMLFAAE
jgi:V/A-type H+-transporting ATPase subunit E